MTGSSQSPSLREARHASVKPIQIIRSTHSKSASELNFGAKDLGPRLVISGSTHGLYAYPSLVLSPWMAGLQGGRLMALRVTLKGEAGQLQLQPEEEVVQAAKDPRPTRRRMSQISFEIDKAQPLFRQVAG